MEFDLSLLLVELHCPVFPFENEEVFSVSFLYTPHEENHDYTDNHAKRKEIDIHSRFQQFVLRLQLCHCLCLRCENYHDKCQERKK